jgi:hypothetical protein
VGGTDISFAYDGLLRRVRMDEGSVHTYFRHDGLNLIEIAKSDGSVRKVTQGYTTTEGIGSATEEDQDGTLRYSEREGRGTKEVETDASGNVTWRGFVNARGLEIVATGSSSSIFWYQGEAWWKVQNIRCEGRSLY